MELEKSSYIVEILQQQLEKYKADSLYNVEVSSTNNDGLTWNIVVLNLGEPCSGQYRANLHFTESYPKEAPYVQMLTPNGRFETNTRLDLCTLDEWNQHTSIKILLQNLVDAMKTGKTTIKGALNMDDNTVRTLADSSFSFVTYRTPDNSLDNTPRLRTSVKDARDLKICIDNCLRDIIPVICNTKSPILPEVTLMDPIDMNIRKEGLPIVRLGIDLSNWDYLKADYWRGMTADQLRTQISTVLVLLLDKLMDYGHSIDKRFSFVKIDLSNTESSMRSIFNGTCNGRPVHREIEVEILNLTRTKTSPQALGMLFRLRNLKQLYLDYCEAIISQGRQAFNTLNKEDPIPNLELLSVVGTSSLLSHKWLSEIQAVCPKLTKIYFTRKKDTKVLGWQDVILMQTMCNPVLLPCGHIGDRASLRQLGYCSFDRKPFRTSEMVELNPSISYLVRDPNNPDKWNVSIVDYHRNPLEAKVLYHKDCGSFFNLSTIKNIPNWNIDEDTISDTFLSKLKTLLCPNCSKSTITMRICYPHSAEQDFEDQEFGDLGKIGAYSMIRIFPQNKKF